MIQYLGEPLTPDALAPQAMARILTLVPDTRTLVTLPTIHVFQRLEYVASLEAQRAARGLSAMTPEERDGIMLRAVDLTLDRGAILIRPDPNRMDLAFEADAILQELVPLESIRYVFLQDPRVREALRNRGQAWRMHRLPKTKEEIRELIAGARIAVGGEAIYFYVLSQGTRLLTYERFAALGERDDAALRLHLVEIADLSTRTNARGFPELDLFMVRPPLNKADLAAVNWTALPGPELRARYEELRTRFQEAVEPIYRRDVIDDERWRNRMYMSLLGRQQDTEFSEAELLGLGDEYFLQIQWMPGARLQHGEILFEFCAGDGPPSPLASDPRLRIVRGLICNLMQQYSDIEFINIGQVTNTLSQRAPSAGRREVYLAHFRERGAPKDMLLIIRMQKYGVREKLNDGMDLLRAMIECEAYTEYILDRRLGCRQLGMNLPPRIYTRKVTERYAGNNRALWGVTIWSPYFERPYVAGVASDKIPASKIRDPHYAAALARLLGQAAAPNLIVGRCDDKGRVTFDDGDEVVIEDAHGMPLDIVVSDHTGTFSNYNGDLAALAREYARAITRRAELVDRAAFAGFYLAGFLERFRQLQAEYRSRKSAFHGLFQHREIDPAGNLAFRWQRVLQRLDAADPEALAQCIRQQAQVG